MLSKERIFSGIPLSYKSLLLRTKHKGLSQALLGQHPKMHVAQVYIQVRQISRKYKTSLTFLHNVWITNMTGHIAIDSPPVTISQGSFGMGHIHFSCCQTHKIKGTPSCPALPQPESPQVLRLRICLQPLQSQPHLDLRSEVERGNTPRTRL